MPPQPLSAAAQDLGGDFSLVLGGPLYRLLLRTGLVKPPLGKLAWRIAAVTGLAWLPLAALTIAGGRFAAGATIPFVHDFEVQARLLFALPMMLVAESIVYARMRAMGAQFIERQIITPSLRPAFEEIVRSTVRLRDSFFIEAALLLFVVLGGRYIGPQVLALQSGSWYSADAPARYWYIFVSIPIFQFVLLRWYFRLFLWARFLARVSRLELNLVPLHPDRCCGIGFLGNVAVAFSPLLMAHTGLVAGFIANRILNNHETLTNYQYEIVGISAFLLAIVLGPLCVFAPKLNQARLAGLRTYGRVASEYVVAFSSKWNTGAEQDSEALLGSADIQSLADLDNSFAIVREVKLVPFGSPTIIRLLLVIALPLAPLLLTMFSLEELVRRLLTIFL